MYFSRLKVIRDFSVRLEFPIVFKLSGVLKRNNPLNVAP
jgi:hypothetical protein